MSLKNKRILITAGPTREMLDPVRYLTNPSSGEMGFSLAMVLQKKGARVTLISGPTHLKSPKKIMFVPVVTALQMDRSVQKNISRADAFVATAAVGDFRFKNQYSEKLKKGNRQNIRLTLLRNPDILKKVGDWKKKKNLARPLLVGFALETSNVKKAAKKKLKDKNLDLIIGNSPVSFSHSKIKPFWLERNGIGRALPMMTKKNLSQRISQWIGEKLK